MQTPRNNVPLPSYLTLQEVAERWEVTVSHIERLACGVSHKYLDNWEAYISENYLPVVDKEAADDKKIFICICDSDEADAIAVARRGSSCYIEGRLVEFEPEEPTPQGILDERIMPLTFFRGPPEPDSPWQREFVIPTPALLAYEQHHGIVPLGQMETPIERLNVPGHPCYSPELALAIRAWRELNASGDTSMLKSKRRDWLKKNGAPDPGEQERIATILTPESKKR